MKNLTEQIHNFLSDGLYFKGISHLTFTIENVEEDAINDIMVEMKFVPYEAVMQFELNALMEITGDDQPLMHAEYNSIVLTITISRTKLNEIPF